MSDELYIERECELTTTAYAPSPMLLRLILPSLALVCAAASAQPAGTLPSPECERALQAVQAREDVAASAPDAAPRADGRRRAPDARLLDLRRRAAQVCLGGKAPVPQRQVQAPVTVAPVTVAPVTVAPVKVTPVTVAPVTVPPVSVTPPAPPPPRNAPPLVITSCDPTGCWASDGSRLNRMGQNLLGPRGLCSVQGNLLQCP